MATLLLALHLLTAMHAHAAKEQVESVRKMTWGCAGFFFYQSLGHHFPPFFFLSADTLLTLFWHVHMCNPNAGFVPSTLCFSVHPACKTRCCALKKNMCRTAEKRHFSTSNLIYSSTSYPPSPHNPPKTFSHATSQQRWKSIVCPAGNGTLRR